MKNLNFLSVGDNNNKDDATEKIKSFFIHEQENDANKIKEKTKMTFCSSVTGNFNRWRLWNESKTQQTSTTDNREYHENCRFKIACQLKEKITMLMVMTLSTIR